MFPCFFDGRTSDFHAFGGRGALNLRSPVGGAAKGTPRNLLTDLNGPEAFGYEVVRPSIFPYFVDTITDGTRGKNAQNMDNVVRRNFEMFLFWNKFYLKGSFVGPLNAILVSK